MITKPDFKRFFDDVYDILSSRGDQYGDPWPLFEGFSKRIEKVVGVKVKQSQAAHIMLELKMERLGSEKDHTDSMKDIAGYVAIMDYLIERERGWLNNIKD